MVTVNEVLVGAEVTYHYDGGAYRYTLDAPGDALADRAEDVIADVEGLFDTAFEDELQVYEFAFDGEEPEDGVFVRGTSFPELPGIAVLPGKDVEETLYHETVHVMRHQERSVYPVREPGRALANLTASGRERERLDAFYNEGFSEWCVSKLAGERSTGEFTRDVGELFYSAYEEQHGEDRPSRKGYHRGTTCHTRQISSTPPVIANGSTRMFPWFSSSIYRGELYRYPHRCMLTTITGKTLRKITVI